MPNLLVKQQQEYPYMSIRKLTY